MRWKMLAAHVNINKCVKFRQNCIHFMGGCQKINSLLLRQSKDQSAIHQLLSRWTILLKYWVWKVIRLLFRSIPKYFNFLLKYRLVFNSMLYRSTKNKWKLKVPKHENFGLEVFPSKKPCQVKNLENSKKNYFFKS